MGHSYRLLGACALGVVAFISCSDASPNVCEDAGVYECIDEPSCTPRFRRGYLDCAVVTQEECAQAAGGLAPEEGHGFCAEWVSEDGSSSFGYELVTFCEENAECPEEEVCGVVGVVGDAMARAECHTPCVSECEQDVDCPEGDSCFRDVCGVCSIITNSCADAIVGVCG